MPQSLNQLLRDIRRCDECKAHLPHGPRPVVQASGTARILIAGQAPGRKVHESGIPFSDASGDRLRDWLGMDSATFYDASRVAIVPMGFCFPGTAKAGDLPPRPECAPKWREPLLSHLSDLKLILLIGQYAQAYHLGNTHKSVTDTVAAWRDHWPTVIPLPHPSPRNQMWFKRNPWFADELLPALRQRVSVILDSARGL